MENVTPVNQVKGCPAIVMRRSFFPEIFTCVRHAQSSPDLTRQGHTPLTMKILNLIPGLASERLLTN